MTSHVSPEPPTMLFVECPLCDMSVPIDLECRMFGCPACAVCVEITGEPGTLVRTAAA